VITPTYIGSVKPVVTAIYTNPGKMCDIIIQPGAPRVEISHGPHHFLNKTPTLHQRISRADYAVTENVGKLPVAKTLQSRI